MTSWDCLNASTDTASGVVLVCGCIHGSGTLIAHQLGTPVLPSSWELQCFPSSDVFTLFFVFVFGGGICSSDITQPWSWSHIIVESMFEVRTTARIPAWSRQTTVSGNVTMSSTDQYYTIIERVHWLHCHKWLWSRQREHLVPLGMCRAWEGWIETMARSLELISWTLAHATWRSYLKLNLWIYCPGQRSWWILPLDSWGLEEQIGLCILGLWPVTWSHGNIQHRAHAFDAIVLQPAWMTMELAGKNCRVAWVVGLLCCALWKNGWACKIAFYSKEQPDVWPCLVWPCTGAAERPFSRGGICERAGKLWSLWVSSARNVAP